MIQRKRTGRYIKGTGIIKEIQTNWNIKLLSRRINRGRLRKGRGHSAGQYRSLNEHRTVPKSKGKPL